MRWPAPRHAAGMEGGVRQQPGRDGMKPTIPIWRHQRREQADNPDTSHIGDEPPGAAMRLGAGRRGGNIVARLLVELYRLNFEETV
jgi:hypothetical protein